MSTPGAMPDHLRAAELRIRQNCPTGKKRYFDKASAEVGLLRARDRYSDAEARNLRVYVCPHCHFYHLGNEFKEAK